MRTDQTSEPTQPPGDGNDTGGEALLDTETSIDLSGVWGDAWATLSPDAQGLLEIASYIGVALIVVSLVTYAWQRRNGKAKAGPLVWTLVIGCLACAPNLLIPGVLHLIDGTATAVISLLNSI